MFENRNKLWLALLLIVAGSIVLFQARKVAAQTTEYPIKSYGAKCDSASNDAPAIQAAVNAAAASGGGIVRFPDNATCVIGGEIKVTGNNIKFVGAGDGRVDAVGTNEATKALNYTTAGNKPGQTRIIVNTSVVSRLPLNHPLRIYQFPGTAISVTGDNFSAEGIRFIGPRVWYKDGNDPAHDGKIFSATKKIVIQKSTFDGVGYAIIRGGLGTTLTFADNICVNWGRTCVGGNKDNVIKNSVFRQTGIDWEGKNPNQPAHDRWSEYATYVYALASSGDYNFTFTNNIVEGTRAGVHANGGAQGIKLRNYTITNNTFKNNRDSIIGSDFGGGARWENVKITNNLFQSDKRYSVYLYKGENIFIENNRFVRTTEQNEGAISSGVRLMPHSDDTDLHTIVIRNNNFDASGATNWSAVTLYELGGYRLGSTRGKVNDIVIEKNKIENLGPNRYGAGLYFTRGDIGRISKVLASCNSMTATGEMGKIDESAFIRFGSQEGSKVPFFAKDVTISDNTIRGNLNSKLVGIYTEGSSALTDGAFSNNKFIDMVIAQQIKAKTTNIQTTSFDPKSDCNPGILATAKVGADLTGSTSEPPVVLPSPESPAPAGQANIAISKAVNLKSVVSGQNLIFTITVDNTGDATAESVIVTDVLASRLQFVDASDGGTFQNGKVTWNLDKVEAKRQKQVTLTVKVN